MDNIYWIHLDWDGCHAELGKVAKCDLNSKGKKILKGVSWKLDGKGSSLFGKVYVEEGSCLYNILRYVVDEDGTLDEVSKELNGLMSVIYYEVGVEGCDYSYDVWKKYRDDYKEWKEKKEKEIVGNINMLI